MAWKGYPFRDFEKQVMELYAEGLNQDKINEKTGFGKPKINNVLQKFGRMYGNSEVYTLELMWTGKARTSIRKLTAEGLSIIEGWKHEVGV